MPLRVAIVGDGIDAAMAAAVLTRRLPPERYQLVLVPTRRDASIFGAAGASVPSVVHFHAEIGISEESVRSSASGTFSLGAAYSDWAGAEHTYFSPFGDIGSPLAGVAFHQLAQRLRTAGEPIRLADYSVAAMLAQTGRFAHPSSDPRSPLSTYSYGLHLDLRGYAQLLLDVAQSGGATRIEGRLETAERGADGSLQAIGCSDGSRIEAEVFIDASGPARLLASSTSNRFQSWAEWIPWDTVVSVESASDIAPAPYSLVASEPFGWRRSVPANGLVGECIAVVSSELGSELAAARLLRDAHGTPLSDPRSAAAEAGRLTEPWQGNCIAIGDAAALVDPAGSNSLHLLQAQLLRLADLFPAAGDAAVLRREYNRLTVQELDRTRDFAILRYKLNRRHGEPLWDRLRAMRVPDELAHKIAQYSDRGRVPMLDGDMLDEIEWALVFDEHGVRPRRYDVLADTVPLDQLKAQLGRMRQLMLTSLKSVPLHGDYLRQPARGAAAA